jgi:hypothetical protein
MTMLDMGGSVPLGGVKNHTVMECPRCSKMVIIPPGLMLRLPNTPDGDFCHETIDNASPPKVYRRG